MKNPSAISQVNFAEFDHLPAGALVDLHVVRRLLSISRPTIYRHLEKGIIPAPRKIGGRILWRVGDLREFLAGGNAK